ncbi:MAG TPA: tripartite tricarboxylate transporter substrate-binding protein [Alphaproteobacteria bacterium]
MTTFSPKTLLCAATTAAALFAAQVPFAGGANAQSPADFYKGKTIKVMVGFGPGGGYDLIARILAKHMADRVPGKPVMIVQNMVGAGGVTAANNVYNVAAKDGLTMAAVNQGAAMYKLLGGEGAQYDPAKFVWIGSMSSSNNVAFAWIATSGVKTIEDAKHKDVLVGGSGVISDANIYPNVLNALIGTKFKIINGYTGTNETNLAIERGELHGRGGGSYASLMSQKADWVKDGKIAILVQVGTEKEPDLPNVPLLIDLAQTEEQKQIAALVSMPVAIGYNHWVAPGVPADRVKALRDAYQATGKDAAFIADMEKGGFDVRLRSGEQLDALVQEAAKIPQPVLDKTKAILGW